MIRIQILHLNIFLKIVQKPGEHDPYKNPKSQLDVIVITFNNIGAK